jgi:curved DNA-binding protein
MKTYYEILGIRREATKDEIKKAFRKLARQYHPDVNPGDKEAEAKFKIVNEAYNTLSDASAKAMYDARLEGGHIDQAPQGAKTVKSPAGYQPFAFEHLDSSFENFFGFNPKTQGAGLDHKEPRKTPMDTTELFERYFQTKKK